MVRSTLADRKTMTRRVVKFPLLDRKGTGCEIAGCEINSCLRQGLEICPYGQPGDRLWVRESWGLCSRYDTTDWCGGSIRGVSRAELRSEFNVEYAADWNDRNQERCYWRPSIYMPRWASRITLEVTAVRAERLQDITEDDAKAEGVGLASALAAFVYDTRGQRAARKSAYRSAFADLWEGINGPGSWDANPWVWVIEFRRVK